MEQPYIDSVDWSKWHVFWVDERVVPKDHPDSNYLLAYNEFLSKVFVSFNKRHYLCVLGMCLGYDTSYCKIMTAKWISC